MTISQRLGAALFMFVILNLSVNFSVTDRDVTDGQHVWEGTPFLDKDHPPLLLTKLHHPLREIPGSPFPRPLTKAAKAPTKSKDNGCSWAQELFRELTQFGRMKPPGR